ncbi:hypothetical protein XACJK48_6290014 [Xanthomonas citri pv. citri]|nr:hypothetical protein XAC3824_790015 [Xanthomonas citri pv. citri]CEE67898.1 hypothetical protein XACLE20_1290001 [Xanthomonas citri pv. citri]CEE68136.1 hypothetical protein XAC71A_840015 [Xanthomonas citri pv. citri]CEF20846.1 hypothetical protein XACJK2_1240029 [Xanthomonas citri pv. citri]CEH49427.1 hypothetical protein XACJK48_6290014 [Xanthomonas citri pv. citri]
MELGQSFCGSLYSLVVADWLGHAFLLWVITSQPKKWLASSLRRLENFGSLEIENI